MTTKDVNESLIGKRVNVVFTGLKVLGTITGIVDNQYTAGFEVKFDEPVNWGGDLYDHCETTARKSDDWGNLNHTELI